MHARHLGVLQLDLGLLQPLLDRLLLLRPAAAQALLELFLGRRGDEDVAGGEARRLDLLDALHLNVQHDRLALGGLLLDRRLGGSVKVITELGAGESASSVGCLSSLDWRTWRGGVAYLSTKPSLAFKSRKASFVTKW